ncbi:ABC transporter ATP-binding protein [Liquorilactobacillus satsumensis]|uniref:ABC transporter ATP-binding protein n=1 Tax=Liquorilactobacillus satsumensis TaxID=259059 RepID=UPI0039EB242A
MKPILQTHSLTFGYPKQNKLFNQLNFSLTKGEILVLLGPNGIGKSTLLKCLCGLLTPSTGKVLIKGQSLNMLSKRQLAKIVAYVPQISTVNHSLSVVDYLVTGRTPLYGWAHMPQLSDYQSAIQLLTRLGLTYLKNHQLTQLSGGQLQLVTIAQALIKQPELIILDEPTSALDFGRQQQIISLIKKLAQQQIAIILSTHNPNHALIFDSKVGLFNKNGAFQLGPSQQIVTEENLRKAYNANLKIFFEPCLNRKVCELI